MFRIEPIKSDLDFLAYDALIFTSKNAISSLNTFNNKWKSNPLYVIAPQTAKVGKSLGGKVKFVGNEKHRDEFAKELLEVLKNKKVLIECFLKNAKWDDSFKAIKLIKINPHFFH